MTNFPPLPFSLPNPLSFNKTEEHSTTRHNKAERKIEKQASKHGFRFLTKMNKILETHVSPCFTPTIHFKQPHFSSFPPGSRKSAFFFLLLLNFLLLLPSLPLQSLKTQSKHTTLSKSAQSSSKRLKKLEGKEKEGKGSH